jgi:hypothetical protein
MQAKRKRFGEDLALVLDRSTWNALGIDAETELEIARDETGIHIRPSPEAHRERVRESVRRMMNVHEETFRKLAQ